MSDFWRHDLDVIQFSDQLSQRSLGSVNVIAGIGYRRIRYILNSNLYLHRCQHLIPGQFGYGTLFWDITVMSRKASLISHTKIKFNTENFFDRRGSINQIIPRKAPASGSVES